MGEFPVTLKWNPWSRKSILGSDVMRIPLRAPDVNIAGPFHIYCNVSRQQQAPRCVILVRAIRVDLNRLIGDSDTGIRLSSCSRSQVLRSPLQQIFSSQQLGVAQVFRSHRALLRHALLVTLAPLPNLQSLMKPLCIFAEEIRDEVREEAGF